MDELDVSSACLRNNARMRDLSPAIAGGKEDHIPFFEFVSRHLFTDFDLLSGGSG